MDKAQLRRDLKKRLAAMSPQQRACKSRKASEHLISTRQFQDASIVMLFLSMPTEIDTSDAILHAWQLGKTVAVPRMFREPEHMLPVVINSLETGLATDSRGLRNPTAGPPVPFADIDLVVTPGLAFDGAGNRLGRGGAYYDKFFAHEQLRACRCGFAFAEQLVDSVPVVEHDQPVDMLVTDREILHFDGRKGE